MEAPAPGIYQKARYAARAAVLKALAHPTRLYIADRLSEREHCVCELARLIGADVSTVSRHLLVMKNAGLVSDDKRGTSVYYRLRVPCILGFFNCVEQVLKLNAEYFRAAAKVRH